MSGRESGLATLVEGREENSSWVRELKRVTVYVKQQDQESEIKFETAEFYRVEGP